MNNQYSNPYLLTVKVSSYLYRYLKFGAVNEAQLESYISGLRKFSKEPGFPSSSKFTSNVIAANGYLKKHLSTGEFSAKDVVGYMYDMITGDCDVSEVIPAAINHYNVVTEAPIGKPSLPDIDPINRVTSKTEIAKGVAPTVEEFEKWVGMVDLSLSTRSWRLRDFVKEASGSETTNKKFNPSEKALVQFLTVFDSKVRANELREVIGWINIAMQHPEFDYNSMCVVGNHGEINMTETTVNVLSFVNKVSAITGGSDASANGKVFKITAGANGKKPHVHFKMQRTGMPDHLYYKNNNLVVGFASTSRDTDIEGNQFLRYAVENAFYNSMMKTLDVTSDIPMPSNKLTRELTEISNRFKTGADTYKWFSSPVAQKNTDDVVIGNVLELIKSDSNSPFNLIGGKEEVSKELKDKKMLHDQFSRSLACVRINAINEGRMPPSNITSPKLNEYDIKELNSYSRMPYFTLSPEARAKPFLSSINPNMAKGVESSLLWKIREKDTSSSIKESGLFRGLSRMAFSTSSGRIGKIVIPTSSAIAIHKNMDFISYASPHDQKKEDSAASALMALMLTDNDNLWGAIEEELSDISDPEFRNDKPNNRFTPRDKGIFAEERRNLFSSMNALFTEISENLPRTEHELKKVIEPFFDSDSIDYAASRIINGGLNKFKERLSYENINITFSASESQRELKSCQTSAALLCAVYSNLPIQPSPESVVKNSDSLGKEPTNKIKFK